MGSRASVTSEPLLRVPIDGLTEGGPRLLDEEAAHYVTRVRRLAVGDRFSAFDVDARTEAVGAVTAIHRGQVLAVFEPLSPATRLPPREVELVQCVGKGEKLESVVRDATELGATAIWPALAERCVASRSTEAALTRQRRVAVEAARQSGRGDIPQLHPPAPLAEVLGRIRAVGRVVLDPRAEPDFGGWLGRTAASSSVAVLVGPEGGLTEAELGLARSLGFEPVRLGWAVLRTETAATAALGAIAAFTVEAPPGAR